MDLNNANGAHVQNGTATETINKAATNGAAKLATGNTAKQETISGKAGAEKPKAEEPKKEEPKAGAEQPKTEITPAKTELSLEGKLKVVDDLHRRSIQRLNLISRRKQLEAFEVALAQENDELEDNPYQGCKLIIRDDKNREFVTTTPGLIRLVSQFIFDACTEKLAEIEAAIIFPSV
ncbi:MAG: hypothetical protein ABI367_11365 [Mucilaginibacter sp.]